MKYQSQYKYSLDLKIDWTILDFYNDEKNKDLIEKIRDERRTAQYLVGASDLIWLLFQTKEAYENWWGKMIDDEMYLTGVHLITQKVLSSFIKSLPTTIDTSIVSTILRGWMTHKYYTVWRYGEKLMDILDKEYEWKIGRECINLFEILIAYHTIEDFEMEANADIILTAMERASIGGIEKLSNEELQAVIIFFTKEDKTYKFSDEWIEFLKLKKGFSDDKIKGFKQIRIKRESETNISLLLAIVTVLFFNHELFLYYNPRLFKLGICDKKNINCEALENYIFVNFSNIIKDLYCEGCLSSKLNKYTKITKQEIVDNPDLIKAMIDAMRDQLLSTCPDDVEIHMIGKVNNKWRIKEIDEMLPNADYIWFDKFSWNKNRVQFWLKDELKKYKKRIKKN